MIHLTWFNSRMTRKSASSCFTYLLYYYWRLWLFRISLLLPTEVMHKLFNRCLRIQTEHFCTWLFASAAHMCATTNWPLKWHTETWEARRYMGTKTINKKSKKWVDMHGLLLASRPLAALKRYTHFILTTYLITSTGYIKEPGRESRSSSTALRSTINLIILRIKQGSTR